MPEEISSIMIDFRLDSNPCPDEITKLIVDPIQTLTKTKLKRISETNSEKRKTICLESLEGEKADILVIIRVYDRKQNSDEKVLLTLTLEFPGAAEETIVNHENLCLEGTLKSILESAFGNSKTNFFPTIRRCVYNNPYLRTSDDRLIEYGFKEVVYSVQSPFQLVEIVDTVDFGKLLILDGMTNLAESDTEAYTHSVMNLPNEDYKGKEVLILGGGDGGLIKELFELKGAPNYVTMVDLDEAVMTGCNKFMKSVCGQYLEPDKRKGDNYEVITGCAIEFMKNAMKEGKKYDYIFGDLTDTPVAANQDANIWNFLKSIISMGVQLLKPNTGKYMTHCNGKSVPDACKAYEEMLMTLNNGKISFERGEKFVPSFMETWMYYRITKQE